jgi:NAD(P)-dependent dehydrogenase (short-subunit alcohol dehydrogenase family)
MVIKHFSQFLPRKMMKESSAEKLEGLPTPAVWAMMSARVGSISDNKLGGWYSYRSSKAAVNSLTKSFDNHLKTSAGENAMAIGLHPGTVKTDLSKEFWNNVKNDKLFMPEQSAKYLVDMVKGIKNDQRGRCWDYAGKEIMP